VDWPVDELVTMEAEEVSRWLTDRGLPGVTFVFFDPHRWAFASWQEAGEITRRQVLESIGATARGTRPVSRARP
jgi:hypothetical protein